MMRRYPTITEDNLKFYLIDLGQDEERIKRQKDREERGSCEYCGKKTGSEKWRSSMTAYNWDTLVDLEDPNRDLFLCDECNDEYCDHWQSMWDEYNASRW